MACSSAALGLPVGPYDTKEPAEIAPLYAERGRLTKTLDKLGYDESDGVLITQLMATTSTVTEASREEGHSYLGRRRNLMLGSTEARGTDPMEWHSWF